MKIKVTNNGTWSTTEKIYDIDDDEIIGILKRVLIEIRDDEIVKNSKIKEEDKTK